MHDKPSVERTHDRIPEIIQNGINGVLVPPDDSCVLAEATTRLAEDRELARKMGENSLKDAQLRHAWRAAADRLLQSYGGACEEW